MEKIKNIFENGKCLKLICGAGNENTEEIEKLSFVYASAGFNMIDICAKSEAIKAAKKGIEAANKTNETAICLSVGLQEDIHLNKILINRQKCINCGKCLETCPQNALFYEDEKVLTDEKKCIGCLRCMKICENEAIIAEPKYKAPHTMLLPFIAEGIDCVEFHCSGSDENLILDSLSKIKSIYNGTISICMDRSKLSDDKIINLITQMYNSKSVDIIQTDGKPMSGGANDYKSTLQSVAFAELVNNANLPLYILLSGGTNSKSSKLAKECGVKINGVALGSYARKLVKEYISHDDFFNNNSMKQKAIDEAKKLADELLLYF